MALTWNHFYGRPKKNNFISTRHTTITVAMGSTAYPCAYGVFFAALAAIWAPVVSLGFSRQQRLDGLLTVAETAGR